MANTNPFKDEPSTKQIVPPSKFDVVYEFRVSRMREGSFKNLWALEAKNPDQKEYVEIVDADMLSTVIDKIRFIFEQDGL
jgi:hypothetical protein